MSVCADGTEAISGPLLPSAVAVHRATGRECSHGLLQTCACKVQFPEISSYRKHQRKNYILESMIFLKKPLPSQDTPLIFHESVLLRCSCEVLFYKKPL